MPQTSNHGYNVPNKGDANWHNPLNANFRQYDTDIEIRDTAGNTGNYTPKQGAKFLAIDTGIVSQGGGSNWIPTLAQYRFSEAGQSGFAGNLVAGHPNNAAGSGVSAATISGGGTANKPNEVRGDAGTVGGGYLNKATDDAATVGGGYFNTAGGSYATVCGGSNNDATGYGSTVAGGRNNTASGREAFAAGRGATANGAGTFVWGDSSQNGVTANQDNEFKVQAGGGAVIFSASDHSAGVNLAPGSGSWSAWSTRSAKEHVEPIDPADALEGVRSIDVSTWSYTGQDESIRHMGPMAEDFYDEFGLGGDRERIAGVDADGVAFGAIQGLSERLDGKDAKIERQRDRIDALEAATERKDDRLKELAAENDLLRDRLTALEARVDELDGGAPSAATSDD